MQNLARNKIIYKNTSSVLFIFAIAARLLYIIFSPLKDTDYELVHIAADNLISGNGLSYPRTYLNDLSLIYHDPMRYWPPLTALMVAFVKWLTESNQAADLILLFAGMISLFLVLKKLVVGFEVIPLFQIMIWLALATNPEPFRSIGISDLYGCLFLLWGLSFCIDYNSIAKSSKARLVFLSLVFFLPAAFRYQYYPVIFVLPLYLILTGVVLKKTTLLYKGLFSLFLVFCFLCLQLILLSVYTNSALFLYNDTKGFFPANLVMMYPLLLKTIINSSYIENLFINNLLWIKYSYLIANSFVLIVFFYFTAVFFSKKLFFIKKSPFLPVDKKNTQLLPCFFNLFCSHSFVGGCFTSLC